VCSYCTAYYELNDDDMICLNEQIVKLKSQLQELHQSYTDVECSNGMLKEEVSYLEVHRQM